MQELITAFRHIFSQYAGQTAIVEPMRKREMRYAELEDFSSRLAAALRPHVRVGGRVAFLLGNELDIALCYLACMQLQVTAVPINTALHANEMAHTLAFATPDVMITTRALNGKVEGAPRFFIDDMSLEILATLPRYHEAPFGALIEDFLALIMFTSGSTGEPKAIPIPFSTLVGHVLALRESKVFGGHDRYYNVLPMSYIGGAQLLLAYLASGSVFILDEAFSARSSYRFWAAVLEHKADTLWLTPSMAATLLAIGLEDSNLRPVIAAQVKRVVIAMGPISSDVKQRFETMFGVRLQKSFGITETLLCCHWDDALDTPEDSVGAALPGVKVIIDSDEGEIRVGGAWILKEYWQQPALTAAAFDTQGYFKTGDIGRVDAQGRVFITGRKKDMIKCGGLNVAPAEIEAVLCRIDGVKEAVVLGLEDIFYGEKIIAFVQMESGRALVTEEAMAYCRTQLSAQKVPAEILLRESLPMNAVGKIDKRKLKAELMQKAGVL